MSICCSPVALQYKTRLQDLYLINSKVSFLIAGRSNLKLEACPVGKQYNTHYYNIANHIALSLKRSSASALRHNNIVIFTTAVPLERMAHATGKKFPIPRRE